MYFDGLMTICSGKLTKGEDKDAGHVKNMSE